MKNIELKLTDRKVIGFSVLGAAFGLLLIGAAPVTALAWII